MWTVSPQHLNKILKTEKYVYFDLWLKKAFWGRQT